MSAGPMTDTPALELLARAVDLACDHDQNQPPDESFSIALEHIAARLRGEAAPCQTCNGHGRIGGPSFYAPDEGGVLCPDCTQTAQVEQQAVAYWLAVDADGTVQYGLTTDDANGGEVARQQVNDWINETDAAQRIVGAYTRPQPVAAAGDAVRALVEGFAAFKPTGDGEMKSDDKGKWYHIDSIVAALSAASATPVAFELNEHTLEILGRPNFACGGLARTLRLRGDEIAKKSEHEQAAVLAFCLGHYIASGTGWREAAEAELVAIVDEARRRHEQSAPAAPSAARDLTGPTVGEAIEAGAIVQDGGEG